MLGVVLWSDPSDRKAVIWCEDQGDLAYVSAGPSGLSPDSFFDAGDLIQFDMEMRESMRHASNLRLVTEKAGPDLPQVLRDGTAVSSPRSSGARVIPFSAPRLSASCLG